MSHFFKADKKKGRITIIATRPKTQTMSKNKYLTLKKLPKSAVREKKGQVRYGNYLCINDIRGVFFSVINISI